MAPSQCRWQPSLKNSKEGALGEPRLVVVRKQRGVRRPSLRGGNVYSKVERATIWKAEGIKKFTRERG